MMDGTINNGVRLEAGQRVHLTGLQSSPELNGREAVVESTAGVTDERVHVRLVPNSQGAQEEPEESLHLRVKPLNLVMVLARSRMAERVNSREYCASASCAFKFTPTVEEEAKLGYTIEEGLKRRKKCAGCMAVFYCSPECQREDWKARHRKRCKELKAIAEREKMLAEGVEAAFHSDEPIADDDLERAQAMVALLDDPAANYVKIADLMESNELTVPGVFRAAVQKCDLWAKVVNALRYDAACFRQSGGQVSSHGQVSNHLLFSLLPGKYLQPSGGFNRLDPGRSLMFARAGGLPALVDLCYEAELSVRRLPHEVWRDHLVGYGRTVSLLLTPGEVSEYVLRHNFQTREECLNLNALMLDPTHDSFAGLFNQSVALLHLHSRRLGIRSDLLGGGKHALIRLDQTGKMMFEQYAVPSAQQMIDLGRSAKVKESREIWAQ